MNAGLQIRFALLVSFSILLLGLGSPLLAQQQGGAERLFDEGNILYQQEDFATALEKYRQIEAMGMVSPALCFNIGNAYYKLDKVGRAVLYYERALRLDPTDEDVLANLGIANQATVDKISPPPEFALASWMRWALYLFPISTLLHALAVLYLMLGTLLMALIVLKGNRFGHLLKKGSFVALILFLVVSILFFLQWRDMKNRVEGIVVAEELPAMDAPGNGGVEVFSIHEGTKVRIEEHSNGWVEIVLLDGKIGWVRSDGVEVI